MITQLEDLSNELLLEIFEYLDPRVVFKTFQNLNTRLNDLLTTVQSLQLIVDHGGNLEALARMAPHVRRLAVNSWDEIELHGFCHLRFLALTRPSPNQLKQIRADMMPKLTSLSLSSSMFTCVPEQLICDVFSNRFSFLRRAQLGHIDTFNPLNWSQSSSLRHLRLSCSHPTMVPFILASCPNLDHLQVHFCKDGEKISFPPPVVVKHPLRQLILRDGCCSVSSADITTLISMLPNVKKLALNFSCSTPFITLINYIAAYLNQLQRFDCDITECPIDLRTDLTAIRQVHPCFYPLVCRIRTDNFRIFHASS